MRAALVFVLALCFVAPVAAQDRTDPLVLAHPDTGETGVWTPVWLQKQFLLTEAQLGSCLKERGNFKLELEQRKLEIHELRESNLDLKVGLDQLKLDAAAQHARAEEAEDASGARLVWAATSTGAAAVAILLLVLEAI